LSNDLPYPKRNSQHPDHLEQHFLAAGKDCQEVCHGVLGFARSNRKGRLTISPGAISLLKYQSLRLSAKAQSRLLLKSYMHACRTGLTERCMNILKCVHKRVHDCICLRLRSSPGDHLSMQRLSSYRRHEGYSIIATHKRTTYRTLVLAILLTVRHSEQCISVCKLSSKHRIGVAAKRASVGFAP